MSTSPLSEPYLIRLEDLTNTYVPVYPSGGVWADTVAYLTSNSAENEIVNELIRQYRQDGRWREPITLESLDYSEDDEPLRVCDGTHRVAAAILMGVESVWVQDYDPGKHEFDPEAPWTTATTIITSTGLHSQLVESWYDILRSFPLDDDTWVTASVMTGSGEYMNICWDNEPTPEFETHYPDITARIISILRAHGADINENEVITLTETETP